MAEEEPEALTESLLDLSNLGRTVDGSGFAFRGGSCIGKRLGPIKAIEGYIQLQTLDLSENLIKDVAPLKGLSLLVKLNLSKNSIASLKGWEAEEEAVFPNLIDLDLSANQLSVLSPAPFQALVSLSVAQNEIASLELGGHERLQTLDISSNKLTTLTGLGACPSLRSLEASRNDLVDLNGLNEAANLEELHVKENKLQALEGPWTELQSLRLLDLSNCQLETEKPLEALRQLPLLRKLKVAGNPLAAEAQDDSIVRVLICHWRLEALDDVLISEEHLEAAKALNQKLILEERERLKEEAAKADES